ncbi:hypothetical protein [Tuberibacillus sp. Marseille-P3662]|uniref:hypothetical protein n=1 Tax=Tuberibacillus sp. Marseille-P3662 TaxID=1965358 RepID=UPI000A1CCEB8|nr:hypothetical protein [Tuberibacillus sp. Marseille-P3662]
MGYLPPVHVKHFEGQPMKSVRHRTPMKVEKAQPVKDHRDQASLHFQKQRLKQMDEKGQRVDIRI